MTYSINGEDILLDCSQCKCCTYNLRKRTKNNSNLRHHCYRCHMSMSVEEICGCGDCLNKALHIEQVGWQWRIPPGTP